MSWSIDLEGFTGIDVADVAVGRETQSPLPNPVRDPVGATLGGGTITVVPVDGYSPWTAADLHGARFTLRHAGHDVMHGHVLDVEGQAGGTGQVRLAVVDLAGQMVGAPYTIPVFPADYRDTASPNDQRRPNAHTQWVLEHLLGQFGLSPHQELLDVNPVVYASLHGSAYPVGDSIVSWSAIEPVASGELIEPFTAASWGLAHGQPVVKVFCTGSVVVPQVAGVSGGVLRMVCAIEPVTSGVPPSAEMFTSGALADGTAFGDTGVSIDGLAGTITAFADNVAGTPVTFEPTVPGYLVVDVSINGGVGDPVLSAEARFRGATVVSTATPQTAALADGVTFNAARLDSHAAGSTDGLVGAWSVDNFPLGATVPDAPAEPQGTLGGFGHVLQVSAPSTAPAGAWDAVKQLAQSGGTVWVGPDGLPRAVGPGGLSTAVPTCTLDSDTLAGLDWATSVNHTASAVHVPYIDLPAVVAEDGIVFRQILAGRLDAGDVGLRSVQLSGAAAVLEQEVTVPLFASPHDDPDVDTPVGTGRARITQHRPAVVKARVWNVQGTSGYPLLTVRLHPDEPQFFETREVAFVEVDTGVSGDVFTVPESAWVQSAGQASDLAWSLRGDLRDPPPETVRFPIANNLTVDVGDVATLDEAYFTGAKYRRVLVSGVQFGGDGRRAVTLRALRDSHDWFAQEPVIVGVTHDDFEAEFGAAGTDPTTHDEWAVSPSQVLGVF